MRSWKCDACCVPDTSNSWLAYFKAHSQWDVGNRKHDARGLAGRTSLPWLHGRLTYSHTRTCTMTRKCVSPHRMYSYIVELLSLFYCISCFVSQSWCCRWKAVTHAKLSWTSMYFMHARWHKVMSAQYPDASMHKRLNEGTNSLQKKAKMSYSK